VEQWRVAIVLLLIMRKDMSREGVTNNNGSDITSCLHITVHNALILQMGIFANFGFSLIFSLIFKISKIALTKV